MGQPNKAFGMWLFFLVACSGTGPDTASGSVEGWDPNTSPDAERDPESGTESDPNSSWTGIRLTAEGRNISAGCQYLAFPDHTTIQSNISSDLTNERNVWIQVAGDATNGGNHAMQYFAWGGCNGCFWMEGRSSGGTSFTATGGGLNGSMNGSLELTEDGSALITSLEINGCQPASR